jgi:hypothetical protein
VREGKTLSAVDERRYKQINKCYLNVRKTIARSNGTKKKNPCRPVMLKSHYCGKVGSVFHTQLNITKQYENGWY